MQNNLEYAQVLQDALDKQLVQQATSGWMEKNAGLVRYAGGAEIKLPVSSMTGLGNYDRVNGKYPAGSVTLAYETKTLKMDRAAQFYFDRNDVDETNYLTEAAAIMAKFQLEHVIPEIDAYRYSKIAEYADGVAGGSKQQTLTEGNVYSSIVAALSALQDKTGLPKKEFVITVSYPVFDLLERSAEIASLMQRQTFEKGDVQTEVNSINGVPVIGAPSERLNTVFEFADGEGAFGFTATGNPVNFIITAKNAPIAVSKTDCLKIFSPDENQDGDGWKTQYRKYHDLWVRKKDLAAVFVSLA